MKSLKITLLSILLLFPLSNLFAQTTTLYYDLSGKGLDTKKKAAFYREVKLDENNNPVDTVQDFYLNGKRKKRGTATVIDKNNDRKSYWKGTVYSYDEKGKLSGVSNYDDNGLLDGIQTTFDDGVKTEEFDYNHGIPKKDYYLAYDKKGAPLHYSYLTHLPMKLATTDKDIVPFTARKVIYQDGYPLQFYFLNGLSVAVKISDKQQYGKYYEAFITIENGSGDQFDFDPTDITASISYLGKVQEGEVYSYNDYMSKVKRRQGWSTAFAAFAEVAAASSAGFSSSTTNAHAESSSGRSISVHATTTSYDGAAAYAATQNAANNLNQLSNQQYDIKNTISQGYLKMNTIFTNSRIVGFVNITAFENADDKIYLNIPVNGKVYHFEFSSGY